ncbi:NADH dehydrogenase [ubiquinone] iron-sulfur protein 6, mitochondrial-like [Musa acuminata AAA Group]|uniref:NADH dehydrogenase [ubiquinone] iron-sulfur protein 6, mitochondrial-like n=1 Tax=Musa acuminata AAA Group TaxID=214697 RepID=UPI0031D94AF0
MAMSASATRRLPRFLKTQNPFRGPPRARAFNFLVSEHTAKWLQDTSKKSPMQLINEVPPVKFEGRIVACEGDNSDPALGHPIEFICLDLEAPAVCKHCGLRYVQDHHH